MLHSKNIKHHGFGLFGRTIFLFVKVGKTWGGSAFCFPLFIHRRAKQTVKNNLKLKTIEVGHCSIYSCSWNAILCIYNICDNMCIYIYIYPMHASRLQPYHAGQWLRGISRQMFVDRGVVWSTVEAQVGGDSWRSKRF